MTRRAWWLVVTGAMGLALASVASNVTTTSQSSGEADTLLTVRSTISTVLNAPAVWVALAVWCGWLVRRPVQAVAAGITGFLVALCAHYGMGWILGLFDVAAVVENVYWFAAALIVGGPLGVVGAIARRRDAWGLLARLVVPVGAVLQPFVVGLFNTPAMLPWPTRVSNTVSGLILIAGGVAGGIAVLVAARRERPLEHA